MAKIPRIRKPVRRVMNLGRGEVVVTLHPNGTIEFRELRRRKSFFLRLAQQYVRAVELDVHRQTRLELEGERASG